MVVVALLAGCPAAPPTPDASSPVGCVEDRDCGPDGLFFCDTRQGECRPACRRSADCGARPAEFALEACAGPLGCACDQGTCVTALCSVDADCGAQLACRNGSCVTPPGVEVVSRCSISPEVVVVKPGAEVRFSVLAWDGAGAPVVVPGGATWSAVGTTLTGTGVGNSQRFTAGVTPGAAPEPAVEARFGNVSCQARALVVPAATDAELAISVFDSRTGRPLSGAQVLLTTPAGDVIAQQGDDTVQTDVRGFAHPAFAADAGAVSVSVFHADYTYVTWANVDGARSLSLALDRNPLDRFGGFAGTLREPPATSNLKLGRVGLSATGELSSLDPLAPPARTTRTDVRIGSAFERIGAPIDSAEFLALADTGLKSHLSAVGQSGTCADEAKVLAGACATRTAWALAGDLPLYDYPFDLVVDWEPLDARPLFERSGGFDAFTSSVVRDVEFPLAPTPRTDAGTPDLSGEAGLVPLSLPFTQTPLAFQFEARLPPFAEPSTRYVAGVGAVRVPGRGLVPLGLGVKLPGGDDTVLFRMAPGHHGLEALEYLLFVERVSRFDLLEGRAGTVLVGRTPRLPFEQVGGPPVALAATQFLALPSGVRVDFAARSVAVPAVAGATAVRVRFTDALGSRWDVTATPGARVVLPVVPGVLRDRLFARGSVAQGARAAISVEARRTAGSFADYAGRDDTQADREFDRLEAFSFFERPAPSISFVDPANIRRGGTVRLAWTGFSPPREGHARVSFSGGTGCSTELVDGTELRLPSSCSGAAVTITAELVQPDGAPLVPPVSSSVTVALE